MPIFSMPPAFTSVAGEKWSLWLLTLSCLAGCSTSPTPSNPPAKTLRDQNGTLNQTRPLKDFYDKWQGVPYRWGGATPTGVDCSALVQIAYANTWQIALPRTTTQQSSVGRRVTPSHARYGDLVFFHITRQEKHVGLYLGQQKFIHASSSQGVMISRMDNPYWASHFWQFRHIKK